MSARVAVLDASAALAALDLNDPRQAAALDALAAAHERGAVVAPALLVWEVGQVVHRKAARAFGPDVSARQALMDALLEGVAFDEGVAPAVRRRVGELAEACGLSYYAAAYLELAERRKARLLTEDARLAEGAGRVGVRVG